MTFIGQQYALHPRELSVCCTAQHVEEDLACIFTAVDARPTCCMTLHSKLHALSSSLVLVIHYHSIIRLLEYELLYLLVTTDSLHLAHLWEVGQERGACSAQSCSVPYISGASSLTAVTMAATAKWHLHAQSSILHPSLAAVASKSATTQIHLT